ncbi:hypothetical protein [Rhodopseudomonas palustris]|uniref:Uncharacterized protein n=1 Tax=Rhodopseudomonas palustris (strain ATCC BAA-98 / CGA009) TaxID=258594 RepID=A0AAF0BNT6_RHOPA|nr:hypothetical protein [Rhodopseudomonas palustris]WAB75924.1 hypothetical protein OR798_15580 [Rhodopseudomonas palustris]WCL93175.1 hypothetical protein TX73_015575 [Rhodopseudomonas palustris CGA009]WND49834.1 hypothetical protein L1A21_15510 [Rhodopseudomonas palustris]
MIAVPTDIRLPRRSKATRQMMSRACLLFLGVAAASTTLLILGVGPSWIAFANLGISLAAAGIAAHPRWTGPALTAAKPWFPRRDRSRANRRATFVSIAAPLLPRPTIRRFKRVARQSDMIHRRRADAEARLRDFGDQISAASMKTSPTIRKLRDLIAVLSIQAVMADEAVKMLAHEIAASIQDQLQDGKTIARGRRQSDDRWIDISPDEWRKLRLDASLAIAHHHASGETAYSQLELAVSVHHGEHCAQQTVLTP